jgi:hypothetical protein
MYLVIDSAGTDYYASISAASGLVAWSAFGTTPWDLTTNTILSGPPSAATHVLFQASAGITASAFAFCVTSLKFDCGTSTCGSTGTTSGTTSSLASNCETACNKIASTCAVSASDCTSSCEDTSGFPSSCLPYVDSLDSCAATTGTVTCQTGGGYEIDGCTSQAQALSNCVSAGGSGATSGGSGSTGSQANCNPDGTWSVSFQWSGRTPDTLTLEISGTSVTQPASAGVSAATGTISVNGEQLTWTMSDGSTWTGNAGASCADISAGTMSSSTGNPGAFTAQKE